MGVSMKFRYLLTLTIFSTTALSQDVYPFFSEPNQQLEFEQERIYIKEFEEQRQLISGGGDEFNPMWLFFNNAPMFKSTPIETSFYYEYTFEIIQNGIALNEIEFLQFIGLNELANNIINDYQNKFVQYQSDMDKWKKNPYYIEEQQNKGLIGIGILSTGMGLLVSFSKSSAKNLGFVLMGGGALGLVLTIPLKIKHENPKPIEPVLKQHLTNDQIKSIAESHNRKVFRTILEKNNQD